MKRCLEVIKLKAKHDWVILRRVDTAAKDSPIYQFGQEDGDRNIGEVISIGDGEFGKYHRHSIKEIELGDKVYFSEFLSSSLDVNGERLYATRVDNIVARIYW